MTQVATVGAASSTPSLYASTPTKPADQSLTADDFLQLLVTQLKNQDPSQPMDSAAMVQQTTELGMMQELSSVQTDTDSSLTLQMQTTAAGLIGKTVNYLDNDGDTASGVVSSVSFSGSSPTVSVDGKTLGLGNILGITSDSAPAS